jgi:hypothetical protein
MAIYFPQTRDAYDPWYGSLVDVLQPALADWAGFLSGLYGLGESIVSAISARERAVAGGWGCAYNGAASGLADVVSCPPILQKNPRALLFT